MTTKEILEGSSLPALLPTALPDDSMGVTIHRLSNGITVYISTDREKPRFSANVPVRTGSRNDPAKSTGLAHYLEHMLFKGTDELGTMDMESERPHIEEVARLYGELRAAEDEAARNVILKKIDEATQESSKFSVPNELSRLYAQLGIEGLNAYTWLDQTVYIADIPANRLAAWAAVEYERFSDPVFRLFYPELEAVYEEKNISLDSPYRRMNQALMASLFPTHPYGTQPTIGLVEHLKTPAYQDMADYFEDWYAPNNMAIVLAGDIDAETAIPVLESTIGQIPARTLGTAEPATVTPMTSRVEQVVEAEGETSIILAWHTVAAGHEDRPAVRILDMLVDNSVSGILNVALTTTQKVARAGSSPSFHKEAGWWEMSATAKEGQTPEELERLLLGVVADLKKGAFTEEDLAAVKLRLELEYQVSLENNYGRVSTMTDAFVEGREWADVVASRARLQEVTREDVLRVANTYLGDAYAVVKRIPGTPTLPKIEKPTISPVELDPSRESEFSERILQIEAPAIEPVWIVEGESYARATSPGASLIAAKNERNQMFTVGYSFDLGSWKQPGI
ncbi:MAG: M16 family metallopeptidase, partial [Nannocystaceae bacterium]